MSEEKKRKAKQPREAGDIDGGHKKHWRQVYASVEDIQQFLADRIYLRHNVITKRVEYREPERDLFSIPRPCSDPLALSGSFPSCARLPVAFPPNLGGEFSSPRPCSDPLALSGSPPNLGGEFNSPPKIGGLSPFGGEFNSPPKLGGGRGGLNKEAMEAWQPVSDRVVNSLWAELSAEKPVRVQDMYRVMESDFVPDFHPFRHYLEHLPPWDGRSDHILAMSVSVQVKGGVEEQMRFAEYLRKWLVAMVAAWVEPGVVNNVILVLIGEQGSYKTTWFNYLLPPELSRYFYTKTNSGRMGRDDLLTLAQYGLVCCEELDTMRPAELNQLKAAVTMPSIDERAAYAHFHEHRDHIASFCGTGNNVQFLSDPTGNRRWLPFEVESIRSPRDDPFDYEGIYSQAYALYRQGFRYWFSQAEVQRLAASNRQFETPRLECDLVNLYFRRPAEGEQGVFMSVARAMQVVGAGITQKLSPVYLGRALGEMGFRRVKYCGQRGYLVIERTAEEIRAVQRTMAAEAERDGDGR